MKKSLKVFGLAVASLLMSASVFAAGLEGITVGGRGAIGTAFGTSVEDGDVDSVFPPDVGITGFIKIPVPVKHLSVQAELGITYKALSLKVDETETNYNYNIVPDYDSNGYLVGSHSEIVPYTYKISYSSDCSWWQIDLPILITYDFEINDKLTVSPELGPKISFPLGDFDFDGFDGSIDSHVLFGIDFGCGMYYKVGPGAIVGDLRYDLGLTKLKVEDEDIMTPRALTFSIGYCYTF